MNKNENYLDMLSEIIPAEPKPFLASRVKAAYKAELATEQKQTASVRWVSIAVAAMLVVNLFLWWDNANSTDSNLENEETIAAVDEQSDLYNLYNNDK